MTTNHIPHNPIYSPHHGFEVIVTGGPLAGILAKFDDDQTPQLTPGGQHRAAMRVARKAAAQGHDVHVRGYMGGLGSYVMEDDPTDDYAYCAESDDASFDWEEPLRDLEREANEDFAYRHGL